MQAYPRYGSRKAGPAHHLLLDHRRAHRQHSELAEVELVPLYDVAAFGQGDPLAGSSIMATLFLHSPVADPLGIWARLFRPLPGHRSSRADIDCRCSRHHGPRWERFRTPRPSSHDACKAQRW